MCQGKDECLKDFFDMFNNEKIQVTNFSDLIAVSALTSIFPWILLDRHKKGFPTMYTEVNQLVNMCLNI